jgi:5-methylcytosine-specific restriction endonuclease McrBC regulatory subunit McrC
VEVEFEEWERGELSAAALEEASGVEADALEEALGGLVRVRSGWKGVVRLEANRRVGEAQVGGLLVRVRPKMALGDLLEVLGWATGARVGLARTALGAGSRRAFTLREALAAGFVLALGELEGAALHRAYATRRETVQVLRGRPEFERVGARPRAMGLACRYVELTRDTPPNRALARAAREARRALAGTSFEAQARERERWFASLARASTGDAQDFALARERLGRHEAAYGPALDLAQMLMLGGGPVSVLGRGGVSGWWVDMPGLFERVVERGAREWAQARGWTVRVQRSREDAVRDAQGQAYRGVRPDLEIWRGGELVAIAEAKYKEYLRAGEDGAPWRQVDSRDIYQVAFYGQAAAPRAPRLLLLCPEEQGVAQIGPRYRALEVGAQRIELVGVRLEGMARGEGLELGL